MWKTKFFQENRKVIIFRRDSNFHSEYRRFFYYNWTNNLVKPKKLSQNCQEINVQQETIVLNQVIYKKERWIFSIVELSSKAILEPTKNSNFTFSHNRRSTNNLICYWIIWTKIISTVTKLFFCSNEAQAKRFHDIFETLDEADSENIRKQYNTLFCLCTKDLLMKTK
jgi:hypothetical protein